MSRLVLHHASGCALSQAVRIMLAAKGLEHELRRVGLAGTDPTLLALNPAGQAPVLEAEGTVLTEAFLILCWLDERFPDPPLGGSDPAARYRVLQLGQLVERAIAPHLALLEWAANPGQAPAADALDRLPPERRALWHQAIAGFPEDTIAGARTGLARALDQCEAWLAEHDWLAGADPTLADVLLVPLVHRLPEAPGPATRCWLAQAVGRFGDAILQEPSRVTMGPERGRWG